MKTASVRLAEPSPQTLLVGGVVDGGFALEPSAAPNSEADASGTGGEAQGSGHDESKIKVLLAEDHRIVRAGIRALLEGIEGIEVVAEASSGHEALLLLDKQQEAGSVPQIAILDISMSGMNGMQTAAHIARRFPFTRVIMLSMHDSEEYVLQSLRAGASGYLLKESGFDELETAVRTVALGQPYLSASVSRHVIIDYRRRLQADQEPRLASDDVGVQTTFIPPATESQTPPAPAQVDTAHLDGDRARARGELVELTRRQREILPLLAQGFSNGQIAKRLSISIKTVETHRAQLMSRLNIFDIAGLVRYAIRHGYIDTP